MSRLNRSNWAARLLMAGALLAPAGAQPPSGPASPAPMSTPADGAKAANSPLTDPRMRKVGERLKCLCGCKATVTSCDMMECRYSSPARAQIVSMINKGEPENAILAWFAKQQGLTALMAPPTEGFYAVGWVMPFVGLLFGFLIVYYFLRQYRKPKVEIAASKAPPVPPQTLDRYRAQIDRDLAQMEE